MISVVHIITKLELGGAQENTLFTVRELDRRRFDVHLWHGPDGLLDADAAATPEAEVAVIPDLIREPRPHRDGRCLVDLVRRLRGLATRGRGPVLVHTHSSKAGILGRAAARAAGVGPVVHTIHGFSFHEGQRRAVFEGYVAAERAAARATDAFIGVSRANLAEAAARGIVGPEHRVALIRSGFDLDAFSAGTTEGPATRRALGIADDEELIVCIANLKPQKDPLTLVRAFARLAPRRPRARLVYAGDGVLRPEVEAELARLGIADRFQLLGWRRDVPALMGAADVVALSSIFEGLPRVSVQALVARRPFVGTRVDGTPEVIRDGRNGYLVEPRDPEAFADALERALIHRPVDPSDVERTRPWRVDVMVEAQAELYERLVAERRRAQS
jgi:glycosyltransferase involved in cell wall biosynthesis